MRCWVGDSLMSSECVIGFESTGVIPDRILSFGELVASWLAWQKLPMTGRGSEDKQDPMPRESSKIHASVEYQAQLQRRKHCRSKWVLQDRVCLLMEFVLEEQSWHRTIVVIQVLAEISAPMGPE